MQDDDIGATIRNVTMIGNHTGISRGFTDRVTKTAFVYWYVGEF